MSNYYIYEIKNLVNGNTYIGQRKCPEDKTPETDIDYMGSGELIRKAIKKYGINNFLKTILEQNIQNKKDCDKRDICWISEYKKNNKAEYNISMGGTGGDLGEDVHKLMRKSWADNYDERIKKMKSQEVRAKMSKSLSKAHKDGKFDNVFTQEVRAKKSKSAKLSWEKDGDKFRDIRKSKEYREKISKGNSGKIRSEENKRKISESIKLLHDNPEYRELFLKRCKENAEKRKGSKAYTIDGKHRWILASEKVPEGAKEGWV